MFSKKATKIYEIFTVDLTLCRKCQIDGEDFVNFCGLLRKHELYKIQAHSKGKQSSKSILIESILCIYNFGRPTARWRVSRGALPECLVGTWFARPRTAAANAAGMQYLVQWWWLCIHRILWLVSSTFQIVQILAHSHFELVSSLPALDATEPVSQPVTQMAVELINIHLISVKQKR